ncbi:MAG: Gldg family protein [Chromatiales bacterium]|nr:Gldg family protein [Chromatiales bacterium]
MMNKGGRILFDRVGLLVLAVVFLVGVALVTLLPAARVDLTQNQLYTLSDGTRKIVGTIPEPVNVYLFFSDKSTADLPQLRTYAGRVREMLEEFANRSDGKLKLRVIDPLPFSEEEDRATAFGLRPINLGNNADPVYFGIAATNSVGDDEIIPFLDPAKESFLEYDLARLVYALANPKKPVVGLLSTLPMTAGFDPMTQQIRQSWVVADQLRQLFDLRMLQPGLDRIEDDIQVLMLVHPKNLPDSTLYAIDQFILKGGHAVIFADPWAEMDQGDPGDPMAGMGGTGRASDLDKLFTAWGVGFDGGNVVGDDRYALTVGRPDGGPVRHLGIIGVTTDGMSQDDVITSGLNVVNMAFAGHITRSEGAAAEVTPVIRSSDQAALIPASQLALASDPDLLRKDFEPTGDRFTLAARITGKVPSAFPADGRPGHLAAAAEPINVLLVADTDLLSDRLWARTQEFLGQRLTTAFANNGDLAVNALDNLLGSGDLISIRSRATFQRPFTRVQDLRREAELRFRSAEERLQAELQETDARLNELQASRPDQGTEILSPQQEAEIERFQARRLELRKELRQVQRDLDRDIERLGTRLKVLNVALVPLIISVLSVGLVLVRRRARRSAVAA